MIHTVRGGGKRRRGGLANKSCFQWSLSTGRLRWEGKGEGGKIRGKKRKDNTSRISGAFANGAGPCPV